MKLSYKIYGGMAAVLILMSVVAGYAINAMNSIGVSLLQIAEEDIPLSNVVAEITVNQLGQALWLERAIGAAAANNAARLTESEHEFEELNALIEEEFVKAEAYAKEAAAHQTTAVAQQKFSTIESSLHEIAGIHLTYAKHAEELFEAFDAGHVGSARQAIASIEEEEDALDGRLEDFLIDIESFTATAATDAAHVEQSALKVLVGLAAVGVLIGAVIGYFLSRSIVAPLLGAVVTMERLSEGDLCNTIDVATSDEIGQLTFQMDDMQTKLIDIVDKIQQASASVKTGVDEISQGNADLSQRSEEQASSLEETASSMEEMTSTVKQNADNAGEANQLALAAREEAEKGGSVVTQAVQAMSEINDSSKKISDIIGVIDEIAFQTNLLALNASVEAARAGDQGRGFAVVASEVRNLAGRSATAAKEIKELIEDSGRKVDEGSRLVNESGETLDEIVNGIKKVTDIVGEIAAASREQSAGIDEVNLAIVQMDEMTQQNAALVEEAAAASESLRDQADDLSQLMQFFTIEHGNTAAANSRAPVREERRAAGRPWAAPAPATGVATLAAAIPVKKAMAGGADEDWEEF